MRSNVLEQLLPYSWGGLVSVDWHERQNSRPIRLNNWDRLRIIAALDTAALHLTGDYLFFGIGLPLFLLLSVALAVSKPKIPDTKRFIRQRIERTLIPWLFWSLIISVSLTCYYTVRGKSAFEWVDMWMVFYGPQIHMWFLPVVSIFGVGAHLFHRRFGHIHYLLPTALVISVTLFMLPAHIDVGPPFRQWSFSLSALPLGYALGRIVAYESRLFYLQRFLVFGFLFFIELALVLYFIDPSTGEYSFRYASSLGLLVLMTWLPNTPDMLSRKIIPLMLGVYILHPTVYMWIVFPILSRLRIEEIGQLHLLTTFMLTMMLVWGLKKTPIRQYL